MGAVAGGQICGRCWRLATGGEGDRLLLLWCSLEAGVDGLPSLLEVLLLELPLLRERLSLAGVGDAASPLLLIAGRGSVDGAAGLRRRCCWPVGWRSVVASSCGEVQKPVSICVAREGRSGAGGEQLG